MNNTKESLPFDPFAVIIGVWKKKYWIIASAIIALGCGAAAGKFLGTRRWDSHCVLLYQPPSVELSGRVYTVPAVHTQLNLVKLRPNLEETRLRLHLPMELETLGRACEVTNPRDTQLLIIRGTSDSATESAAIANTLADVFMGNQRRVRNGELKDAQDYLDGRKRDLSDKLQKAQAEGEQQKVAMKDPEDVQREIRSHQTKLDALDVIYEKALSERKSLQSQVDRIATLIDDVKTKIATEEEEAAAVEGLSNLNIRVERIREAIMDERQDRTNDITLAQWKSRLDYDKQLLEKGYLSQAMYDHELAQFEKLQAQAVDSEQIKAWKEELQQLYSKIRPSNNKDTASAPILRDLMLRSFNLQLEFDGINEHIAKTKESRDEIAKDLNALIASQNTAGAERWQVQSWRDELSEVDRSIAIVQSLQKSNVSDFRIVSRAEASPKPAKSNRRLLAVAVAGMLSLMGFGVVLGKELVCTRVRTAGEVALVANEPVLGCFARKTNIQPNSGDEQPLAIEQVRRIAKSLSHLKSGRRILVSGCHHGDGSSTIAAQIAACLARQQRNVTVLDSDLRSPEAGLCDWFSVEPHSNGLSELLCDGKKRHTEVLRTVQEPHLKFIPRGTERTTPELLGSQRMREILDELARDTDVVLIDGPPVCDYADAEFLAEHVDGVLLVVRSKKCTRSDLKAAARRVRETGKQLIGFVLNDVDPVYLPKA